MKIVSFASARPNFVKLAAVYHALKDRADAEHIIIHTGQHTDPLFSDIFFEQLAIAHPNHNLSVESKGDNQNTILRTRDAALPVLESIQPDVVLVYGDVSGAVGGALAAHQLKIPIGHVEAGLRSFDETMPEEGNRKQIDYISQLLFVSEESGIINLENENITEGIHLVGNTMIDTLMRMLASIKEQKLPFDLPESYVVVTLHRPSNVDSKEDLQRNIDFLNQLSEQLPIIFPMHRRTEAMLKRFGMEDALSSSIYCIDPLGYLQFLCLVSSAAFVLTDSGGIQEEAVLFKKRCFTLRKNTERPSTITSGSNILIDIEHEEERRIVLDFAGHPITPNVTIPQLWDGKAGGRILAILNEGL